MDLNICLYCERYLSEENMNFCSSVCQAREASKPISSRLYMMGSRLPTTSINYESAQHRRSSFSSDHCPLPSSSSSSINSTYSLTSLDSNTKQHYHISYHILLSQPSRHSDPQPNQQNVYTNCFFA
ncbi:hypothetical protein A0J61_09307 [Choanephora cucurbitarum]|uniref:Uncharacterized protein n=1 Tax=Choanephora cucurbitarum TaxID=101091 RepID=A0A1C7N5L4_9FUNG|nr:hypothetical protein A0J61_09307 [Choanephora cucurbitarum]